MYPILTVPYPESVLSLPYPNSAYLCPVLTVPNLYPIPAVPYLYPILAIFHLYPILRVISLHWQCPIWIISWQCSLYPIMCPICSLSYSRLRCPILSVSYPWISALSWLLVYLPSYLCCTGTISYGLYELIIQIFWKVSLLWYPILMIQSNYKFAHVMTAQLSWHVQNCDQIGSLYFKQEQHECLQDLDYELINPYEMVWQWSTCGNQYPSNKCSANMASKLTSTQGWGDTAGRAAGHQWTGEL